ncbi:unnamed protein product, partial [Clonostachys chloroleuca]
DNRGVKSLVQHLYLTICTLHFYKRNKGPPRNAIVETDKALLEGWKALLKTIKALSTEAPCGHFLAARMMLFLMHAFEYQQGFLYGLLDSAVNRDEPCVIWEESEKRQDFKRVLAHLDSKNEIIRTGYNQADILAL